MTSPVTVDARFERAYRRFGWRIFTAYVVFVWAVVLTIMVALLLLATIIYCVRLNAQLKARLIRADRQFDDLPIIAMTAHAMQEERDRCRASGMNDHLVKPIHPATLYEMIERWCPTRLVEPDPAGPKPAQPAHPD